MHCDITRGNHLTTTLSDVLKHAVWQELRQKANYVYMR